MSYDVVIIGGGLGGLSAATALTQKGFRVVLVEKNEQLGGNCRSFTEEGYRFDYALHQLNGAGNNTALVNRILDEYNVLDQLNFQQVDPFMTIVYEDAEYNLSSNWEQLQEDLSNYFPENRPEIYRFYSKVLHDIQDISVIQRFLYGKNPIIRNIIKDVPLKEKVKAPFRAPLLFTQTGKTGIQYLQRYISNPKLWSLITASWPYLGLPPSAVSGLMLGGFIATEHHEKTYYPIGSSQTITDVLVESIYKNGGEIICGDPVAEILTKGNFAEGVLLASGQKIDARVVVSNADLNHTCTLIKDKNCNLKELGKVKKMKPSIGPFRVFLGLDIDIHKKGMPNFEYLFYKTYDHCDSYKGMTTGHQKVFSAYSPSGIDPSAAPEGHSTLILLTMFAWDPTERDWRTHTETVADEMINVIEKRIPDVKQHIKYKKIMTPQSLSKYTNTFQGAMYGWELSPEQSILKRVPQKTPIKNLFLSGHWTQPGPGMTTAIVSGWMASHLITKDLKKQHEAIT